jgi:hypothetical protein
LFLKYGYCVWFSIATKKHMKKTYFLMYKWKYLSEEYENIYNIFVYNKIFF